jgi:hypothetical protein
VCVSVCLSQDSVISETIKPLNGNGLNLPDQEVLKSPIKTQLYPRTQIIVGALINHDNYKHDYENLRRGIYDGADTIFII